MEYTHNPYNCHYRLHCYIDPKPSAVSYPCEVFLPEKNLKEGRHSVGDVIPYDRVDNDTRIQQKSPLDEFDPYDNV